MNIQNQTFAELSRLDRYFHENETIKFDGFFGLGFKEELGNGRVPPIVNILKRTELPVFSVSLNK